MTKLLAFAIAFLLSGLSGQVAHAAPPAQLSATTVGSTIPLNFQPGLLAADAVRNRLYILNGREDVVEVFDAATQTRVGRIGVDSSPVGVAVNSLTNRVYVTNLWANAVSVIDGATLTVIARIGVGSFPRMIAVNAATNRIYVTNQQSASVSVIDGVTNSVIATIAVPRNPEGVAVNPLTNRIYVSSFFSTLTTIDGATNATVASLQVGPQNPFGLAYFLVGIGVNPATNRIYVANMATNQMFVVDGGTNTILAAVPVGTQPQGVAINPITNRIYVANYMSNNVSVLDGSTNAVATIAVDQNPLGVAVNPNTGRTYVTNGYTYTVSVLIEEDTTAPEISATVTPAPNTSGWSNSDVSLQWTLSDPGSGIASSTGCDASTFTADTSGTSMTCSATNGAGLSASRSVTVKIDKSAPTITANATTAGGAYAAGSWTNQAVTVHYSCADALSGVATCTGDEVFSAEGSIPGTSGTATDNAGNASSAAFGPIQIDRTAPTIAFSGNAGTYEVDQIIAITCSAADTGSGIAATTCPMVAERPATAYVMTSTTTATLMATAADNAGNSTTAATSFTVAVTADGICRLSASLSHADSVCGRIRSIASAPNDAAKAGQLRGFDNLLAAQHDVSSDLAALLSRLARLL